MGHTRLQGKAAEVRALAPAICALWRQGMSAGDVYHVAICQALTASCRMDEILSTHKEHYRLPDDVAREFAQQGFKYVQQHMVVHNYQGDRLFNITFKHHVLVHCVIRAQSISPRVSWCYMGEDWMKWVRKIGAPCTRGLQMAHVHKKLIIHFLRAMEYRYENM